MKKRNVILGAHMSTSGGLHEAIIRAEAIECDTMQIFTKSNRMWTSKKITKEESALFKETLKKSNLEKIMAHAAYLINLASSSKDTLDKSIKALADELYRCKELSIPYLILHTGSHGGIGVEKGIEQSIAALDEVLERDEGNTKILLETSAGQGLSIGRTFEQLKALYDGVKNKERIGICLDTCHIFSAGYDISNKREYEETIKKFENIIGLNLLYAIHLNDTKKGLGSNLDRHEKIGKGALGLQTFELIVNDERFDGIPMVLETPIEKSYEEYGKELEILRRLIK